MTIVQELMNILKTMPLYVIGLLKDHTVLFIAAAVVFIFVTFFTNKVANKLRTIFVLGSLLLIVFSFISQSWPRIVFITLGLLVMMFCRAIGFAISEIRIIRRNKRIEERALAKAAKRRGNWENKRGYSGARRLIIEPEYIPEEMDQNEIEDVIKYETTDKKPEDFIEKTEETTEEIIVEEVTKTDDAEAEDVVIEEVKAEVGGDTAELPIIEE